MFTITQDVTSSLSISTSNAGRCSSRHSSRLTASCWYQPLRRASHRVTSVTRDTTSRRPDDGKYRCNLYSLQGDFN